MAWGAVGLLSTASAVNAFNSAFELSLKNCLKNYFFSSCHISYDVSFVADAAEKFQDPGWCAQLFAMQRHDAHLQQGKHHNVPHGRDLFWLSVSVFVLVANEDGPERHCCDDHSVDFRCKRHPVRVDLLWCTQG